MLIVATYWLFPSIQTSPIYQAYISDPYNYSKVRKILEKQVGESTGITIVDTDKFDNIYRWTLQAGSKRVQIRVFPSEQPEQLGIVITRINDEDATAECLKEERNMIIDGISGEPDGVFAKKTGIQFTTIPELHGSLGAITNQLKSWPKEQRRAGRLDEVVVWYNCESRVLK